MTRSHTINDEDFIGMPIQDAKDAIFERGLRLVVVREDKDNFITACNYDVCRLRLEIDNGVVTKVGRG